MSIRTRAALAVGLSLTTLLAACGGGGSNGSKVEGGAVTMRGCNPQNPLITTSTSEVCGGDVLDAVSSGLVRYNAQSGAPEKDMAESIETTDNQHFTVKLKPGRKFSDGTEVKAKNFVDAWNWGAYGPNAQINSYFFEPIKDYEDLQSDKGAQPKAKEMSGLKVVDDHTFTIETTQKLANLEVRLGHTPFMPLPDVFFKDTEAYGKKPISAGPLMVENWTPNREIVLVKNPHYDGPDKTQVGKVTFRIYQNSDAAYKDAQAGNLDIDNDPPQSALINEKYKNDFKDRNISAPIAGNGTISFAPKETDPSVQNPKLRQALSMAIDRETISKQIFAGARVPATGWVPPAVDGHKAGGCGEYCTYNPTKAKQLLQEAGGYTGTLTFSYNADSDHGPWTKAVCNNIKQNLGINCVSTPVVDFKTFRTQITKHEMKGMFRSGWQMDYPSIENFLTPQFSTGGSSNDGKYSNPEFDKKLAEAAEAASLEEANKEYQDAESMLAEDMPSIPMFDYTRQVVYSDRISDIKITKKGTIDWASLKVKG
ncbi:peptide ABC transporter substrate-binding protein [Dermatophilus congolensis]|uniref:peptide ABC transporter substrate-binding protein n=1 Tax=Dermatophilus congolensis TaxID=1863 RepID=UPI001AB05F15|nr:ABC transporter substrate-binding protein [Dermatophilus congolensis]MBO3145787.1 ABC transporter substrate-binding protein [Dermatophilus congolensis]